MRELSEQEAAENLLNLPEKQLVRYILNYWGTVHDFFNYMVVDALGSFPRIGWDYLFLAEIPITELGFRAGIQPGDIDILIVPSHEGEAKVEHAAAIEVKRLALRGPNWNKNVDRYGVRQAHGLLRCGFPYVGILHLIVNAPGPAENHREIEEWRVLDDGTDQLERVGSKVSDMTGWLSAERQFHRLSALPIHPAVGLNAVAIGNGSKPLEKFNTMPHQRPAQRNRANPKLLENLRNYIEWMRPSFRDRPADVRRSQGS